VADAALDEPSAVEAAGERAELLRRALEMLQHEVEERTYQAFWRAAVEGHAAADIAADLGLTVNAVYLAKGRLLRRLREEFGELID
jgi:RNA polymerase sigma-70 factor (ECF subfamily)